MKYSISDCISNFIEQCPYFSKQLCECNNAKIIKKTEVIPKYLVVYISNSDANVKCPKKIVIEEVEYFRIHFNSFNNKEEWKITKSKNYDSIITAETVSIVIYRSDEYSFVFLVNSIFYRRE